MRRAPKYPRNQRTSKMTIRTSSMWSPPDGVICSCNVGARLLLVTLLLIAGCASATNVDAVLQKHRDKAIAVAFYDLRDGRTFYRNEREVFHAASTVRVRNEFTSIFDGSPYVLDPKDDSDNEMYKIIGREVPLDYLVRRMIVRSSNLATNNVIELIGAKQVMSLMKRIGANDI